MKLQHLTIKDINAFTGDPRVIDFTAQPEGLICIRGDNGAGKSTVMSFSGPSTLYLDDPDRGSLYGCARSADGSTVLEFEHGGSDYKIEVAVDVHTTKRGNLHQSMKPRIWKDGAEVKGIEGKNHAYLDYVNKMFGSKEDFLATVYAAQTGEGKFDKLDRGNRKDMFRRMLGLDHYEVLAERCKAKRKAGEDEIPAIKKEIERRETDAEAVAEMEKRIESLAVKVADAEQKLNASSVVLDALTREHMAMEERKGTHERAKARRGDLERNIETCSRELSECDRGHQQTIDDLEATEAKLRTAQETHKENLEVVDILEYQRTEAIEEWRAASEAAKDASISEEKARAARDTAQKEYDESRAADMAIIGLADKRGELEKIIDELPGLREELEKARKLNDRKEALIATISRLRSQVERDEATSKLLSVVPCASTPMATECQLLKNANGAQARSVVGRVELNQLIDEEEGICFTPKDDLYEIGKRHLDLTSRERQLQSDIGKASGKEDIAGLMGERRDTLVVTGGLYITASEANADANKQLDSSTHKGRTIAQDLTERKGDATASAEAVNRNAETVKHLQETIAQHEPKKARLRASIAAYRDELSRLEAVEYSADEHAVITAQVNTAEQEKHEAQRDHSAAARELSQCEGRVSLFQESAAKLKPAQAQLAETERHNRQWGKLESSLKQLQVYLIDAAAPAVSQYVNDLLRECYGERFCVELATERKNKTNDGYAEVYDIQVIDGVTDYDGPLSGLSGGEKTIISSALQMALILIRNENRSIPIQTVWMDERDGALSSSRAVRWFQMLHRFRVLGGFHHVLFVSHRDELQGMADGVIEL